MSAIGWLAYSESEKRRFHTTLAQLEESDTVDSLGLGRVRDALADLLFPGVSTIQTRPRYFLIVPWIYLNLERRSPIDRAGGRARDEEIWALQTLSRAYSDAGVNGADRDHLEGIIGLIAGATLVQLPSEIYWQGMAAWQIRSYPGTRAAYHRLLELHDLRGPELDDDGEPLPGEARPRWDPTIEDLEPEDLWAEPTLALSRDEGDYLYGRITTAQADSALAQLLTQPKRRADTEYPWQLPKGDLAALSERNQRIVRHADLFSLAMNGAALVYNHMLAVKSERPELEERYEKRFARWASDVRKRADELSAWRADIEDLWETAKLSNPAIPGPREREFIEDWTRRIVAGNPEQQIGDKEAHELVAEREKRLKKKQARLINRSALEAWGGASGWRRLTYRWPNAQRVLDDIRAARAMEAVDALA